MSATSEKENLGNEGRIPLITYQNISSLKSTFRDNLSLTEALSKAIGPKAAVDWLLTNANTPYEILVGCILMENVNLQPSQKELLYLAQTRILKEYVALTAIDSRGRSLIELAYDQGSYTMVIALVKSYKIDLNSHVHQIALAKACRDNRVKVVSAYAKAIDYTTLTNINSYRFPTIGSYLRLASVHHSHDVVEYLLSQDVSFCVDSDQDQRLGPDPEEIEDTLYHTYTTTNEYPSIRKRIEELNRAKQEKRERIQGKVSEDVQTKKVLPSMEVKENKSIPTYTEIMEAAIDKGLSKVIRVLMGKPYWSKITESDCDLKDIAQRLVELNLDMNEIIPAGNADQLLYLAPLFLELFSVCLRTDTNTARCTARCLYDMYAEAAILNSEVPGKESSSEKIHELMRSFLWEIVEKGCVEIMHL